MAAVKAARGPIAITASGVRASATSLNFSLDFQLGLPTGPWDLVTTDVTGQEVKHAGAVTLVAAQTQPSVKIQAVQPATAARNAGSPVQIDISGTGLSAAHGIRLKMGTNPPIDASNTQFSGNILKSTFNIDSTAPVGKWDVLPLDAQGTEISTGNLPSAFTIT